jgi:RNA polymerase sigma-70 factor, ECF subfamily
MDREITLLAVARQLNGDALTEIFELYAPSLYKYAYRLYQDAGLADQLVGFIFERCVQELSDGRHPGVNLRLYLYEIAYGIAKGDTHYAYPFAPTDKLILMNYDRGYANLAAEDKRLLADIHRALICNLKADQRNVVILRFMEGFTLKETARITGKKINNVKVIQNRAIVALQQAVGASATEKQRITLFLRRMANA